MKAQVLFHCSAAIALVLSVATVPSHATERRDPPMMPDSTQTLAGRFPGTAHSAVLSKTAAPKSAQKQQATSAANGKNGHQGVKPSFDAKDKSGAKKNSSGSTASNAHDEAGTSSAAK